MPAEESLEAAVMIDMSVRDRDRAEVGHIDLHDVEVVLQRERRQSAVVQDRSSPALGSTVTSAEKPCSASSES